MIEPGILRDGDHVYRVVFPVLGSSRASVVIMECVLVFKYAINSLNFEVQVHRFDSAAIEEVLQQVRDKIQEYVNTNDVAEKWSYRVVNTTPPQASLIGTMGTLCIDSQDLYLHREDAVDAATKIADRSVRKLRRDIRSIE